MAVLAIGSAPRTAEAAMLLCIYDDPELCDPGGGGGGGGPCANAQNYNVSAANAFNGHGVRVNNPGMLVQDQVVNCVRISSIGVVKDDFNFVEIGWAEDPTAHSQGCEASSQPEVFAYRVVNDVVACWVGNPPVGGQYDSFRVDDDNSNAIWTFYWEGDLIAGFTTTFTNGLLFNNGERFTLADPMYSNFDGMDRIGGWRQLGSVGFCQLLC
ncbi:MAG: hypothetical protein ACRDHV_06400 [Actinomycetota bacterium]